MNYEVFPFGKYKGVKLTELPTTYIAFALEQFQLPEELINQMYRILLGRLNVYSNIRTLVIQTPKRKLVDYLTEKVERYEKSI